MPKKLRALDSLVYIGSELVFKKQASSLLVLHFAPKTMTLTPMSRLELLSVLCHFYVFECDENRPHLVLDRGDCHGVVVKNDLQELAVLDGVDWGDVAAVPANGVDVFVKVKVVRLQAELKVQILVKLLAP